MNKTYCILECPSKSFNGEKRDYHYFLECDGYHLHLYLPVGGLQKEMATYGGLYIKNEYSSANVFFKKFPEFTDELGFWIDEKFLIKAGFTSRPPKDIEILCYLYTR